MKENIYSAGGRPLFNEDLSAIEDHLKAIHNIFASETPFVISGMQYSGTTSSTSITEGYVWLADKIRYVPAQTGLDLSSGAYLTENSSPVTQRVYEDGNNRDAVGDYGVSVVLSTPTGGNSQLDITDGDSVRRYYKNVLGDKFLQLDASDTQTILTDLSLQGSITSTGAISTSSNITGAILTATDKVVSANGYETSSGGLAINPNGTVATNKVVTDSVADNNITRGHIQDDAIGSDQIQDGQVTENELSDSVKELFGEIDSVPSGASSVKTRVIDLGNWNMLGNDFTTVSLSSFSNDELEKIVSFEVIIYDDGFNASYPLISNVGLGYWSLGVAPKTATLNIDSGSIFESSEFDSSSQNRGYIKIDYLVS